MPNCRRKRFIELDYRLTDLYIDGLSCHVKHGDLDNALAMLHEIMAKKNLPDSQRARAHYYSGLLLLQQGKNSGALKEFTQALKVQSGHESAGEEVKKIEARTEMMDLDEK